MTAGAEFLSNAVRWIVSRAVSLHGVVIRTVSLDGVIRTLSLGGVINSVSLDGVIRTVSLGGVIRAASLGGVIRTVSLGGVIHSFKSLCQRKSFSFRWASHTGP